jgi:hypothetical protein
MTTTPLPLTMKCISVRVPWTWYLMYANKDIENRGRTFPRQWRGRVLLQASNWWNEEEIRCDIEDASRMWAKNHIRAEGAPELTLRHLDETRGHVIGTVEFADYVFDSNSPWFVGDLGIVIRGAIPFAKPIRLKGNRGLFNVDVSTPEFQEQLLPAFSLAA